MTIARELEAGGPADSTREDPACALCGSGERHERFREPPYAVVECRRCGLVYVTPRRTAPALLAEVYDDGYWRSACASTRGYTDYVADEELYLRTFGRRLRSIAHHLPGSGALLDVGCAAGYFLRVARDAGWEVQGVEPSEAIRAEAVRSIGASRIHAGVLETAPVRAGSFDVITMWDVLEHVPDPIDTLRSARRALAPGGRLVIETQDVDSLAARVLGRRWQHFKHEEHLVHFGRSTLRRALASAGLRPVHTTRRGTGKYVSPAFVVERLGRVAPALSALLRPLARLERPGLWVNPLDELIVIAEAC